MLSSCCEALIETAELRQGGANRKNKFSRSSMSTYLEPVLGKDAYLVETAARAVHRFLVDEGSALKRLLGALSDGGMQFVSFVWVKTATGFCRHSRSSSVHFAGVSQDDFVGIVVHWLCSHH